LEQTADIDATGKDVVADIAQQLSFPAAEPESRDPLADVTVASNKPKTSCDVAAASDTSSNSVSFAVISVILRPLHDLIDFDMS